MGRKRKNGTSIDLAVEKVIKEEFINTAFIQRKLQISYLTARKIIKQLFEIGYIESDNEFENIKVIKHKYIQ